MKTITYVVFLILMPFVAFAQSAEQLTKELEATYLSGKGVSATFSLGSEGKMSLVVAPRTNNFRIENGQSIIVSDGSTTWNFNKKMKQVVIDKAGSSNKKESRSISEMFIFSNNYSTSLAAAKKNKWELVLTPLDPVKKIYDQAGISSIIFSLMRSATGKPLKVTSILANANGIKTKIGNVKIVVLKTIPETTFTFAIPKGAKVTDLRD